MSTFLKMKMSNQKPQEIAKEFNKFFTSVGPTLVGKIPDTEKPFQTILTSHNEKIQFEELNLNLRKHLKVQN